MTVITDWYYSADQTDVMRNVDNFSNIQKQHTNGKKSLYLPWTGAKKTIELESDVHSQFKCCHKTNEKSHTLLGKTWINIPQLAALTVSGSATWLLEIRMWRNHYRVFESSWSLLFIRPWNPA